MNQLKYILPVSMIFILSCTAGTSYQKAENALDAGREFIDGCLKGDFEKAAFYMVPDSENTHDLHEIQKDYASKTNEERQQYNTASIIINSEETLSDSVHLIYYSNSFDKIARKVKVVRLANEWKVDFKYTFNGNL